MGRKITARLLPVFGILFTTAYIRSAAADVVYTDYIRLVNFYLGNVFSLKPYLHPDILTRIPINYFERIINVVFFRYSTMFDMMLGALGLGFTAFVAASFCNKRKVSWGQTCIILMVIFSLNKWEMLTNGSGWVHFMAFALFWYHYLLYDRVLMGEAKAGDRTRLLVLPWIVILFFAGPYCAIYAVTLILADLFAILILKKDRQECLKRILCTLLPLILYMISRAMSVEERAGATTDSFTTVMAAHPGLIPSFFLRSFSSMLFGEETMEAYGIARSATIVLGLLVLGFYAYAFYLNFREKLYNQTVFPLILLVSGFLNHVLVTLSRWIFLDDAYGMSSRYALQYQVGIVGILLTLSLTRKKDSTAGRKTAAVVISLLFLFGNLLTTGREIHAAKYRKEHFLAMTEAAEKFETLSDSQLADIFQYYDGAKTRKALTLLKERRLNVYSRDE
jgi:hypothetical protein